MNFKNQISAFLLAACLGLGGQALAQEKKEEQRVKLVYVKDGKKHVLDETYTGEMSEALKKKIAAFKAEMGDAEMHFHTNTSTQGHKGENVFIFHGDGEEGETNGVIKATIKQADGSTKMVERKFANHEEMAKVVKELKAHGDNLLTMDIRIDKDIDEVIEIDGEGVEGGKGRVIVIQDGKKVISETFEGEEIPAEIQQKIEELKKNGKPIKVDVDIEAIEKHIGNHADGKHKVIIKTDKGGSWKEIDSDQVKEIKVIAGDDGKQVIIEHQGEGKGEYQYEYVMEDISEEDDGKHKVVKIIIHSVMIEDIHENDKDIPKNLRESQGKAFGEAMSGLSFFPNPNNGSFDLKFNLQEKGDTQVEVIDLTGKVVFEDRLDNFSGDYSKRIELQNQPKGFYILKVSQNDYVMTKKVVVE